MDPIEKLIDGYGTFRDGRFREQRALYEELIDRGQQPKVAVVACADSRVDPAIVLQADPGDLFIVRNVANLVPPNERGGRYHGTSAALEFAVRHLEVAHVIVLGHAGCGGIRSLFEPADQEGRRDRFIRAWMELMRQACDEVRSAMPNAPVEAQARACEKRAVLASLDNLTTFPFIRRRVADGQLRLHGWYIDIRSCTLQVYDSVRETFAPIG